MSDPVNAITVVVPKEYPAILLACAILCTMIFCFGPCLVFPARSKHFNDEFME